MTSASGDRGNLLLVGVGPHSRRFYLPAVASLGPHHGVRLCAAVDLRGTEQRVASELFDLGLRAEVLGVPSFSEKMPEQVANDLKNMVARLGIDAVIISTDPLSHKAYALWAMDMGLHVLLDKPVTTRRDAVIDLEQAEGIERDWIDLARAYRARAEKERRSFIVCAHRRYHPGIQALVDRIASVTGQTGCPVTAIHSHHSDGQWRLPNEMVTQDHHSYHQGHGKASHSGHHFLDSIFRFYRAGLTPGKEADSLLVYSSFIQPDGHLVQINETDYERLFGPEYRDVRVKTDAELLPLMRRFGELDVGAVLTFQRNGMPVCLGSLELLHNGFSRRFWLHPGSDLYKGNGRVKHEHHRVQVGPFMAAHVHSYQAKDDHARSQSEDRHIGGNNHFQIVFFHNTGMLPGTREVEVLELGDICEIDDNRLHIEEIKEQVVLEFLLCVTGKMDAGASRSGLLDQEVPVKMLSSLYRSHVLGRAGENPVVRIPLSWEKPA